ncbi:GGDEF domain-containing protein [Dechloromonas denitrificans]|uniref:GGDEF domain-containing protein n=1 Tax=Dechloromonas denitrificans TaxID=281362 RepID=UPI001CFB38EB|nr:GGDEF domain-containing protein [Dechloromonas denitrificans]UCV08943.1 GGDEF domain-containing protein [Dechloromonas denitrificans]
MRRSLEMYRLLGWLALLLVAGFLATNGLAYRAAHETIRRVFAGSSVPAISDLVHAEINRELQRLASTSSVRPEDSPGERLFRPEERSLRSGIRVNPDLSKRDASVGVTKYPIVDGQGNFLGVGGGGLPQGSFFRLAERYRARFGCRVYLVDKAGIVIVGGNVMQHLRDLPGLNQIAADLLATPATPLQTRYPRGAATVFVNARFIPELEWFLIVERSDEEEILALRQGYLFNLLVAALVTGLVLASVYGAIRRARRSSSGVAGIDPLTGLINRAAYEFVFHQTLLEVARAGESLSFILLEVDMIKRVVAVLGDRAGEGVLQRMAELAKAAVRGSDPVVRWSDSGFAIQLRDCPLDRAVTIAEQLRRSVAAHDFELNDQRLVITASLGVARFEEDELGSDFMERTHEMLGRARRLGGNRVAFEIPDGQFSP